MGAMFYGQPVVEEAMKFAWKKHINQTRQFDGAPYFDHLVEVAVTLHWAGLGSQVIAAGFLHDVKEDQGVTNDELVDKFGAFVALLVDEVTNVAEDKSLGNREYRQGLEREHLGGACSAAKSIKLADVLSNTRDIVDVNPKFAPGYLEEKRLLLPYLRTGDRVLFELAEQQIERQAKRLRKRA
jgi:(p)ppGpp synthase/HD superfamily hydrolase